MFNSTKAPLAQTVLRFAGVVQSLVAFPCMIYLAARAFGYWSHPYDIWYYFTCFVLTSSACGGIIFTAAVQWKASTTSYQTLRLEVIKSVLATGLFIWTNPIVGFYDVKRLILTGLAVIVLFYAPLYYAYISWKEGKSMEGLSFEDNRRTSYTDSSEKAPLLRQE